MNLFVSIQKYRQLAKILPFIEKIVMYWGLIVELIDIAEALRGPKTGVQKKEDVMEQFTESVQIAHAKGLIDDDLRSFMLLGAPYLINRIVDALYKQKPIDAVDTTGPSTGGTSPSGGSSSGSVGSGPATNPTPTTPSIYFQRRERPRPENNTLRAMGYVVGDQVTENATHWSVVPAGQPTLGAPVVHVVF